MYLEVTCCTAKNSRAVSSASSVAFVLSMDTYYVRTMCHDAFFVIYGRREGG